MKLSIYADGSSTGRKNKPGGYGYVIVGEYPEGEIKELAWGYGGSPSTTNNLMELEGGIQGLEKALEMKLHEGASYIELVSDSRYMLGMASGGYTPQKNIEKAKRIRELAQTIKCDFRWVKGHKNNHYNELCDRLAKLGKKNNTEEQE